MCLGLMPVIQADAEQTGTAPTVVQLSQSVDGIRIGLYRNTQYSVSVWINSDRSWASTANFGRGVTTVSGSWSTSRKDGQLYVDLKPNSASMANISDPFGDIRDYGFTLGFSDWGGNILLFSEIGVFTNAPIGTNFGWVSSEENKGTPPPSGGNPSGWAQADVNRAINLGLVPQSLRSSYTNNMSRAEFALLAVTLYEKERGTIGGRSYFTDTNDVNVQKAAAIGVVTGVGNNRFDPNGRVTREQAAVMLERLATAVGRPLPYHGAPTFSDDRNTSTWAFIAIGCMQSTGIMTGTGNNMFSPKGPYTREQSIVTILRTYNFVTGGSGGTPTPPPPPASITQGVYVNNKSDYTSPGYYPTIEIRANNRFLLTENYFEGMASIEGTYTFNGTHITCTLPEAFLYFSRGTTIRFRVSGNSLIFEGPDISMTWIGDVFRLR